MEQGDTANSLFGEEEGTSFPIAAAGGAGAAAPSQAPALAAKVVKMEYAGGERGVVATTDLEAGQLVALEWPILEWTGMDMSSNQALAAVSELIHRNVEALGVAGELHPRSLDLLHPDERNQFESSEMFPDQSPPEVKDELRRILFVLKHNGFESGLYLSLCMFNHSCQPNCIKFSPRPGSRGASEIWTTRPVKAGEELLVSYFSPLEASSATIREYLLRQHNFRCHCPRCEHFLQNVQNDELADYWKLVQSVEEGIHHHQESILGADPEALLRAMADIQEVLLVDTLLDALHAHDNHHTLALIYDAMVSVCSAFFQCVDATPIQISPDDILHALQCWLNASVHLFLVQRQYLGEHHPSLATSLTDVANCLDSLKRLFSSKSPPTTYTSLDLEAWIEQLELPFLAPRASTDTASSLTAALAKYAKTEASRLRDMYHVVKRHPEVAFVKKQAGLTHWGRPLTRR